MKMAKPDANDIAAAEELMQVLQLIDARFGGPWSDPEAGDSLSELLDNGEEVFDSDNGLHLRTLYNNLARLLRDAPNFYARVISGMCHVIMNEKNQILNPDSDTIDLHPRFAEPVAGELQELPADPAVAAIAYALDLRTEEPMEFLRLWNQGDFEECREGWPDAPAEVYIGADLLFVPTAQEVKP